MENDKLDRLELERLIAERTLELEQINKHLLQEIDERKQVEEALRVQKDFIDQIIQTSPNLIFVKDRDGFFLMVNQATADSFGMSRNALLQKNNADVHRHPEEVEAYLKVDREVIETGETRILEEPFTTPAGEQRWYQTIKTPFVQPDGTVHVLGISTDITDLKRAQETADENAELERLVSELEAKNAELERFTYTVSHDLKTPLVTIMGFLGLLEKDLAKMDEEAIQRDMTIIRQGAEKMSRLLNELLELSRIGRLVNPGAVVSPTDLAREAVELLAGPIGENAVTVEIASSMPLVLGDRLRLLQVFQNLIENAVKFMGDQPEPRVEVGAYGEDGEVVCFVRDNGAGVDPRFHDKIFGLFERLNPHVDGTGIGLALVKRIIEVHHGRIWIDSEGDGGGATFYFAVPAHK